MSWDYDPHYEAYKIKQAPSKIHEDVIVPAIVEKNLTVMAAIDFIIATSPVTPEWADWQLAYWEPLRGPRNRDENANVFELLEEEELDENSLLLNALYDWEPTAHPFAFEIDDAEGVVYEVVCAPTAEGRAVANTASALAALSGDWTRPGLHGVEFLDWEQLAALVAIGEVTEEDAEQLRKLSFKASGSHVSHYGTDVVPLIAKAFDYNLEPPLARRRHFVGRKDGRPLCRAEARYIDRNNLTQHRFEYYRGVPLQHHYGQFGGTMVYFPPSYRTDEPDFDSPLCYSCASELEPKEQDKLLSDCSYNHDVYDQVFCAECNVPIYPVEDIVGDGNGYGDEEPDEDEPDEDEEETE